PDARLANGEPTCSRTVAIPVRGGPSLSVRQQAQLRCPVLGVAAQRPVAILFVAATACTNPAEPRLLPGSYSLVSVDGVSPPVLRWATRLALASCAFSADVGNWSRSLTSA